VNRLLMAMLYYGPREVRGGAEIDIELVNFVVAEQV
jgi:hypothetical protein